MSTRGLGHAAAGVAALTMLGNALGFIRDMVLAAVYGAGAHTDAFVVAWTVPETFSPLLMEGLIPLVLVPWLVRHTTTRRELHRALGSVWWVILGGGLLLGMLVAAAAPVVVRLVAGSLPAADLAATCVALAAGTIPAMSVAGVLGAILRSTGALVLPALVYAGYNIGILLTILVLQSHLGILAAALGLSIGGLLMVLVQLPAVLRRTGMIRPRALSAARLATALVVSVPTLSYLFARQGQVFVERQVGSGLTEGSITYLNLAQKLGQLPVTLVMALALVSFPAIARLAHGGDTAAVAALTTRVGGVVLALLVPVAGLLAVTAAPVVTLAFGRGRFDPQAVQATAATLSVYVLGLVAQAVVNVAVLTFFGTDRGTWIPAAWLSVCLLATLVVAWAAASVWGTRGIAAGNVTGIAVAAIGLTHALHRRGLLRLGELGAPLTRAVAVVGIGVLGSHLAGRVLNGLWPGEAAPAAAAAAEVPSTAVSLGQLTGATLAFSAAAITVNLATRGALRRDLTVAVRPEAALADKGST